MLQPNHEILLKARQDAAYIMQCDINYIKFSIPEQTENPGILRMTADVTNKSLVYHLSSTHLRRLYYIERIL